MEQTNRNRIKFKDLDPKEKISYGSAVLALIVGFGLTIAAFIVEPAGQIHDSVLWLIGQILIFSGGIFGVGVYTTGSVRGMKREINRYMKHREYTEDVPFEDEFDNKDERNEM